MMLNVGRMNAKPSGLTETLIMEIMDGTDQMWGIDRAFKTGQMILRHGEGWAVQSVKRIVTSDIVTVTLTRAMRSSESAVGLGIATPLANGR